MLMQFVKARTVQTLGHVAKLRCADLRTTLTFFYFFVFFVTLTNAFHDVRPHIVVLYSLPPCNNLMKKSYVCMTTVRPKQPYFITLCTTDATLYHTQHSVYTIIHCCQIHYYMLFKIIMS